MHIEDWYDEGHDAAWDEIEYAVEEFNNGKTYNPFDWIAYVESNNGDVRIQVEKSNGAFIARFEDSPVAELHTFMERLEEGLE